MYSGIWKLLNYCRFKYLAEYVDKELRDLKKKFILKASVVRVKF